MRVGSPVLRGRLVVVLEVVVVVEVVVLFRIFAALSFLVAWSTPKIFGVT